jgi:hypothetical protein
MTSCSQLADEIFARCCPRNHLHPESKAKVKTYIIRHLRAGEGSIVDLVDGRLLGLLQFSKEDGETLMAGINSELERLRKSGVACDSR